MTDSIQVIEAASSMESVTRITNDNLQLSIPNTNEIQARPEGEIAHKTTPDIVQAYIAAAVSENTRKAYQGDLADFLKWGGSVPCSPDTLAAYIANRAESLSPHTITRRIVGISRAHVSQELPDPAKNDLVRTVLRGVRKTHGKPQRQVAPLLKQDLLSLLPLMQGTKGTRDRALLLLGFAAALRRSELVALDVHSLAFVSEGMVIQLARSKTDQEGSGRKIAVPYGRTCACPVKAVQQWLEHAQITSGPVFPSVSKGGQIGDRLTAQSVALILKSYAEAAGLKASDIAGHSLRSGLVTSAAQVGVSAYKIQQQTGHRSAEMLSRYIRDANMFENNAAGLLL